MGYDNLDKQAVLAIERAFSTDRVLWGRIQAAIDVHQHGMPELLVDIANFINRGQDDGTAQIPTSNGSAPIEPANKKRKIDPENPLDRSLPASFAVDFESNDVSFSMPLRKKLRLQLVHEKDDQQAKAIHLRQGQTGALELAMDAKDVDQIFCLPVPDKAQRQKNFVITVKDDATAVDGAPIEPIVFTVNEVKGKHERVSLATHGEDETLADITLRELDHFVKSLGKKTIVPDEREFASAIVQAHRKNEKAYHVKAFRGSKEGYLFFLPTGILFGFKKPLLYFPFSHIHAVSFTSVLQRTFNLVITSLSDPTTSSTEPETTEYEFSMLDQADFAGIDAYIKRHGLNDASLAESRRAKAYNVNKEKGAEDGEEGGGEQDGVGELEKAQQQIEDEEDEEEEDYDPGSEGESEGEGEDSEEEDADGGDANGYGDGGDDGGEEL